MFGSAMLDIAIGVVFVFLLLSIFATAINELILSLFNLRGRMLLRGIESLLTTDAGNDFVNKVYSHWQIFGLYEGKFDPSKTKKNLPSYIPSKNFALALLDVVEATKRLVPLIAAAPAAAPPAAGTGSALPPVITISQDLKNAAIALADDQHTANFGKFLVNMINTAGDDAAKLESNIEQWFNSAMDRVSGWYKHRTQTMLLCIGLVMALTLNANTINIVRKLSQDPTLRQTMVEAAKNAKPPEPAQAPTSGASPSSTPSGEKDPPKTPIDRQIRDTQAAFSALTSFGLPLGYQPGAIRAFWKSPSAFGARVPLENLLGWILTAFAISLGAPFWFDSLNKIMVVRSTIKPTEKSQPEKSKD